MRTKHALYVVEIKHAKSIMDISCPSIDFMTGCLDSPEMATKEPKFTKSILYSRPKRLAGDPPSPPRLSSGNGGQAANATLTHSLHRPPLSPTKSADKGPDPPSSRFGSGTTEGKAKIPRCPNPSPDFVPQGGTTSGKLLFLEALSLALSILLQSCLLSLIRSTRLATRLTTKLRRSGLPRVQPVGFTTVSQPRRSPIRGDPPPRPPRARRGPVRRPDLPAPAPFAGNFALQFPVSSVQFPVS
jgi:hypothetical protein